MLAACWPHHTRSAPRRGGRVRLLFAAGRAAAARTRAAADFAKLIGVGGLFAWGLAAYRGSRIEPAGL